MAGAEDIWRHQFYRTMGGLGEEIGEGLKGSARCTIDLIKVALFDRERDLFSEVGLVFFDTTCIYFEGPGGESIGQYGHSKDHRPDLRQMIGHCLGRRGSGRWVAKCGRAKQPASKAWSGSLSAWTRSLFRVREVCVVADRGFVSAATIVAMEKMEPPVHDVIGVRMRRSKQVEQVVLQDRSAWQEVTPERTRAKDLAPLKVNPSF